MGNEGIRGEEKGGSVVVYPEVVSHQLKSYIVIRTLWYRTTAFVTLGLKRRHLL